MGRIIKYSQTYVAYFRTPRDIDEIVFEGLLWKQLALIHAEDVQNGMKWAENYSDNPKQLLLIHLINLQICVN